MGILIADINFKEKTTSSTPSPSLGLDTEDIHDLRDKLRRAIEARRDWRSEAKEDYNFYFGNQWSAADLARLQEEKRPCITINGIKPRINLLSGYQRLNRYEPDFLPRKADDIELCQLRKGITKFVMDTTGYEEAESHVFLDGIIGGLGFFAVEYEWEEDKLEGNICVTRCSPFEVFPDPECKKPDYSDAEYWCRARWISRARLIAAYPEFKEEIKAMTRRLDEGELMEDNDFLTDGEHLWYNRDTKKLRLVEVWESSHERRDSYLMKDGTLIDRKKIQVDQMNSVVRQVKWPRTDIRMKAWVGNLKLEDKDSPYEHGLFPFVGYQAYYMGEWDTPSGVVRDLKDPQREKNKRRSQALHILNNQANSGWIGDEGSLDAKQEEVVKKFGSVPGVIIKKKPGTSLVRMTPEPYPVAVSEMEKISEQDMRDLSGVNPEMLGVGVPASASGRAIELRQKQAVTQIAALFDNLRSTKKQVLQRFWGTKGRKGLVQQYYDSEKTFRITQPGGGTGFITVNQKISELDPVTGEAIERTLNDLSVGEFDIVVTDTPATATQRLANYYMLIDMANSGIPVPPEVMLEATDIGDKEAIKKIMQDQKIAQMQMIAQKEAELRVKAAEKAGEFMQQRSAPQINYRDLPDEGKVQAAAKAGINLTTPILDEGVPKIIANVSYKDLPQPMQAQMLGDIGWLPRMPQPPVGQFMAMSPVGTAGAGMPPPSNVAPPVTPAAYPANSPLMRPLMGQGRIMPRPNRGDIFRQSGPAL